MKSNILPAIKLTVAFAILFMFLYTGVILLAAKASNGKGLGKQIVVNNKRYFTNIAQSFTNDKYFSARPSAVAYNAAGSGGSNKGPTNPVYLAEIKNRIDTFLIHNPTVIKQQIPAELLTASGSGLDPHISVAAAMVQVNRIAAIRKIAAVNIKQLIYKNIQPPLLGIFGTSTVNVLLLNIELDNLQ